MPSPIQRAARSLVRELIQSTHTPKPKKTRIPPHPSITAKPSRHIPARIRYLVLTRDQYRCVLGGRKPPEIKLHLDHIHPFSRGGKHTIHNLRTLCQTCNLGKGNLTN